MRANVLGRCLPKKQLSSLTALEPDDEAFTRFSPPALAHSQFRWTTPVHTFWRSEHNASTPSAF